MGKLFGTDGIRGIYGEDLTEDLARRLGEVVGHVLAANNHQIIIGRDTRGSGEALEKALTAGLISVGCDVYHVGVIPTPAIAFLARELGMAGGVVISASHNPPRYNGLKVIGGDGYKLSDEQESEIEDYLTNTTDLKTQKVGSAHTIADATTKYIEKSLSSADVSLDGLRIAIDCGHGAASKTTPESFERLGATVHVVNDSYDGTDINVNCGSTNLKVISELVRETNADLGIAHDGDADRVLAVDELGNEIDGDMIMVICAHSMKHEQKLNNNLVVATVMSNLGFVKAMEADDINLLRTKVGDRYVLEEMRKHNASLGGEQSGHVIFLNHNTTGDGLVTAIQLALTLKKSGKKLSELAKIMTKYPQVLINVPVKDKNDLDKNKNIAEAVTQAEKELGDRGRLLVRPSGTENLVRVMAEAETEKLAAKVVDNIVKVVVAELS